MIMFSEINLKTAIDIDDWSKIKYFVKCHWGIHVNKNYPDPVIQEFYFEDFKSLEEFVSWYELENSSINKQILLIQEVAKTFRVERYEVTTKVRVVQ